ncbi:MAG: LacI family DNA-binding transcriptional regulator [Motilibacteraceae bacterium]
MARLAGVSPTTVSFVINDRPGLPEATRQRVREAIDALGYRPNRAARGLRTRRTHTLGFLTDEIAVTPFAGRTVTGAHDVAWKQQTLLLIANTTRDQRVISTAVDELLDRQVDGIVFAAVSTRQVTLPATTRAVPTVLVNCFAPGDALPCVLPDEEAGGSAAAQILLEAGHRHIAHLAGLKGTWATRERLKGFRAVLARAGAPLDPDLLRFGTFRTDSGYALMRELLQHENVPTAVFCGNDRMALGAYLALKEAGLRIPEDVSVVGYDDQEELAAEVHPGLTTIGLPFYEMGRWAVEHLLAGDVEGLPARTYLPCPPALRGSVAAPHRRPRRPRL